MQPFIRQSVLIVLRELKKSLIVVNIICDRMKKTKLIQLISTFSSKEMKDFGEFVRSPFYNKNQKLVALTERIRKVHPDMESQKLLKIEIFAYLFPKEKYNDTKMRLVTSELLKLAEKYLIVLHQSQIPVSETLHLLYELNARKIDTQIESLLVRVHKEIESSVLIHEETFYFRILLDQVRFSYYFRIHNGRWDKVLKKFDIVGTTLPIQRFFLFHLSHLQAALVSYSKSFNLPVKNHTYDKVYELLSVESNTDHPLRISYLMLKMIETLERKFFVEAEQYISDPEKFRLIPEYLKRNFFGILHQFCFLKIRNGETEFRQFRFRLQKIQVANKLHLNIDGTLPHTFFIPFVMTAIEVSELKWAWEFVKINGSFIHSEIRKSVINYASALLYFEEKKYQDALAQLNSIEDYGIFVKANRRCLIARIYYEKNEGPALKSLLDSFRHFLQNTDMIGTEMKLMYQRFIKILTQLQNIRSRPALKKLARIRNEIERSQLIPNRDWLFLKTDELTQKRTVNR